MQEKFLHLKTKPKKMNSAVLINIARFIILILAQVAFFDKINFLGYINPYPYILFIILYPVNANKNGLLLASFLLGLTMDMFNYSGGVHAASCLTLAYLRPTFFKFSFAQMMASNAFVGS